MMLTFFVNSFVAGIPPFYESLIMDWSVFAI